MSGQMSDAVPIPTDIMLRLLEERGEHLAEPHLQTGGGGGTSGGMESRVTALETHMEYVRRDMDALRVGQDEILNAVRELPTRRDLAAWKLQWTGLAFAAVAIVIGGIIGGLAWIKPDAAPPTPIVVQMPAPVAAPIVPRKP